VKKYQYLPVAVMNIALLKIRDVPDFGSGSGKSGIRPFFGDPAKSGSGQNFDRIWPDLGQLSRVVIFFNNS